MYKSTLTYLALAVVFALFMASCSQAAESAQVVVSGETQTEMGVPVEDFEDFYLDSESDEDQEERELTKRALPKLRRIFIGKRGVEENLNEALLAAKRAAHPRRHLFIGKRSGDRMKKGRIHRIFIG